MPESSVVLTWSGSATNATIPSPTPYYTPTFPTINSSFTAAPTQTGTPSSCQAYFQAEPGDTCLRILDMYRFITRDEFMSWNPALNGSCNALRIGYWYCVANFGSNLPLPPTLAANGTVVPSPKAWGSTGDCTSWFLPSSGSHNCRTIALAFGTFSESDFISWNPSVWSDCSNFKNDIYYCVAVPSTPSTRTAPIPSTTSPPTAMPTQPGTAAYCDRLWLVGLSDTCDSIATANGLSIDELIAWNTALALDANTTDCKPVPDFYVCVSLEGDTPRSNETSTAFWANGTATANTTSSTVSLVATSLPSPIIPNVIQTCQRFYLIQRADSCATISGDIGVDES
ncbi:hypothetical protein AAE478_007978 [Parahypoxylon ruwenzoriense]